MARFRYKARDESGAQVVDVIEAPSRDEAIVRVRGLGRTVIELRSEHDALDVEEIRIQRAARGVKRDQVIEFSGQLAVMIETGVPLSEALDAYLKQGKVGNMGRVVDVVREGVTSGASFSAAMGAFPTVFPQLMTSLVRASEASGTMAVMLRRVSEYLGKERRITKQIKGALTYPTVMMTMALAVTGFLMVWVLPRFAKIYQTRGAALPTPTRIVLAVSEFFQTRWVELGVGVAIAGVLFFFFARSPRGRYSLDWLRLHAPVFGPMYTKYYLTRATRTLGTLLIAGVPLVEAIKIVRTVTNNVLWDRLWSELIESLTEGKTISEVVTKSYLIPPPVAQMISAGERSGKLPEVLARVAESSETDLDEAIKTGTQLIEPAMIMVMGLLIGGMALALLLPIFTISSTMAQ